MTPVDVAVSLALLAVILVAFIVLAIALFMMSENAGGSWWIRFRRKGGRR